MERRARRRHPAWTARKHAHIDRGGRAFLPQSRMRAIRWEESVTRSIARRDGLVDYKVVHAVFHCGLECMGVPIVVPLTARRRRVR